MSQALRHYDDVPEIDPDVWEAIYPKSNKDFKGKVIITSTPKGISSSEHNQEQLQELMGLVRKLIDMGLITGRIISDDEYQCIMSFYLGGGVAYCMTKHYAKYSHLETKIEIVSVGYDEGRHKRINHRMKKENLNVFQMMYLTHKVKQLVANSLF